VTEGKSSEDALRASELRYRRLFESAKDGILILDPASGYIEDVNPFLIDLLGYTHAEYLGKALWEIGPFRNVEATKFEFGQLQEKGYVRYDDLPLESRDGRQIAVEFVSNAYMVDHKMVIQCNIRDITKRKRAEDALRESEKRYRLLFERNLAGVYRSTLDGRILECNEAFARIFGYASREEILGGSAAQLYETAEARDEFVELLRREGHLLNHEARGRRKDGSRITFLENVSLLEGDILEGTVIDVTGHRTLEERLRQVQKMEAIGRLAGGVAHDFNNLLGVIMGYGEIVLKRLGGDDPLRVKVEQILRAAHHGAALTHQLLAFSRKQVLQPRVLDLNVVVSETEPLLRPLVGEDTELRTRLDPHLGSVRADADQLQQVIMNLAVNARDAMPEGGRLTIETSNADLDAAFAASHPPARPGRYVLLAVSDTGSGMDDYTQAHAFEPFFTTKETGKGTGLGLSTVYGVVKQSDGYIWIYSELGVGTTFKIYLPRIEEVALTLPEESPAPLVRGSETVLLVEDEATLRDLVRETLEGNGYTVLAARDGAQAMQIADVHAGAIHVMVTDLIMPGMTGRSAADSIRAVRPEMKVLYISGYSEEAIMRRGALGSGAAFLGKPFTSEGFLRKVRDLLGASTSTPVLPRLP